MGIRTICGTVGMSLGMLAVAMLAVASAHSEAAPHTILVEAEGFDELGGWVIDTQVMDQMGSPYLMAHGLGRPVADAVTRVAFPAAGTYRVLVRTRDWAAPFGAPESPGRFQVLVGGKPLPVVFGTEGAETTGASVIPTTASAGSAATSVRIRWNWFGTHRSGSARSGSSPVRRAGAKGR